MPRILRLTALLIAAAGAPGCASERAATDSTENVVLRWNNAALQAIRDTRPGPPQTARALAIVHTCIFDAWAAFDGVAVGTRLGGSLRQPPGQHSDENKSEASSFAAQRCLSDLYPSESAKFSALLQELGYPLDGAQSRPESPAAIGLRAADAVIAFRHGDGSNQLGDLVPGAGPYADYTGYAPVNPPLEVALPTPLLDIPNPDRWQALTYVDALGRRVTPRFIAPHWGHVLPFALTSPSQLRPVPPAPLGSAAYQAQVDEVLAYSAALTDREKCIAEYWADGPSSELPPGHFNLFAQQISRRGNHSLDDDVKLFFALTNAVFDAGIATWEAKAHYDYVRPISAVRYLYNGRSVRAWAGPGLGTRDVPGESWKPFQPDSFPTPPFAEYTSGHSAFSAAGAEVLKRFTGSDAFGASATIQARSLKAEPQSPAQDVTLRWATFSEAADEAGLSRLYGGIHFRDGDLNGRRIGRQAGTLAFNKARAYWEGTASANAPVDDTPR